MYLAGGVPDSAGAGSARGEEVVRERLEVVFVRGPVKDLQLPAGRVDVPVGPDLDPRDDPYGAVPRVLAREGYLPARDDDTLPSGGRAYRLEIDDPVVPGRTGVEGVVVTQVLHDPAARPEVRRESLLGQILDCGAQRRIEPAPLSG